MAKKVRSAKNFLLTTRGVIRSIFSKKVKRDALEVYYDTIQSVIKNLENHPVSQELKNHTEPSKILNSSGWPRRGTLFGFMGFNSGRDPVDELRDFLTSKNGFRIDLEKNVIKRVRGILGFLISPSEEELQIAGITLDGWGDGRSWPTVLEDSGIENLPYFLAKNNYGRSQEGFQIENELNPGAKLDKLGKKYLSKIFKDAESKFKKDLINRVQRR